MSTLILLYLAQKKKNTRVSGNEGEEKNLHRAAAKNFFINLIEFFKSSLHLKNYSNTTFLC